MSTLYEITGDMLRLLSMAEDLEDEQALMETMDAMTGEFKDKADGYARIITELVTEAERVDFEIGRLTERRDRMNKNANRIKKHLEDAMKATGNVDFKTTLFNFKIKRNPPKVVVTDETKIPAIFFNEKVVKTLDKTALKEGLKCCEIEGAHLEQDEKLTIK